MRRPGSHEEHIGRSFDAYCKKVVKHEARDCQREIARRGAREVALRPVGAGYGGSRRH